MCDVVVVMVHLFESMPDPDDNESNVRWKEFSDQLVQKLQDVTWPVIYQLDFITKEGYGRLFNQTTRITESQFGQRWQYFKQFGDRIANNNLVMRPGDHVSTSDQETAMIISYRDPKIVLFGGMHTDRCVSQTREAVLTADREYHVSDRLSYSWRQTWQDG